MRNKRANACEDLIKEEDLIEAVCAHFCNKLAKETDETELIGRFLKMKKEERSENPSHMT